MTCTEKALNAIGDPTRRTILEKIRSKPLSVAEIAKGMSVSRPAVSQHLKILRDAKLVAIRHEGTRSVCHIDQKGVLLMKNYLSTYNS